MTELGDEIRAMELFAQQAIVAPSWCHVLTNDGHADEWAAFAHLGAITRRVRGRKMPTWNRLDDEFAAAWQFADYFGPSSGAFFHDSLGELHLTWPTTKGFVVIVTEPERVLDKEGAPHEALPKLVREFAEAAEWYAEDEERDPDDPLFRGPLSFDVVLVTDAEHRDRVHHLWKQAGAPLAD